MSRPTRYYPGGYVYHVLNRGNNRQRVFHTDYDYGQFLKVMHETQRQVSMRVLAYCLMPNHFHFVLWPHEDNDISNWLSWLLTTQVSRHHRRYGTSGHLWQGRHKSFPVQDDEHLLIVYRYVERNALRAGFVQRAENWRWCSLWALRHLPLPPYLVRGPVTRGTGWIEHVNQPQSDAEIAAIRECVARGRPYGDDQWQRETAARLHLESTLKRRGRPSSTPPR
jgi:putative transposase